MMCIHVMVGWGTDMTMFEAAKAFALLVSSEGTTPDDQVSLPALHLIVLKSEQTWTPSIMIAGD